MLVLLHECHDLPIHFRQLNLLGRLRVERVMTSSYLSALTSANMTEVTCYGFRDVTDVDAAEPPLRGRGGKREGVGGGGQQVPRGD